MTAHRLQAAIATLRLQLAQIASDDLAAAAELSLQIATLEGQLRRELSGCATPTSELARLWRDAPADAATQIQLALELR